MKLKNLWLSVLLVAAPAMGSPITLTVSGMGPVVNQTQSLQFQSLGGLVNLSMAGADGPGFPTPILPDQFWSGGIDLFHQVNILSGDTVIASVSISGDVLMGSRSGGDSVDPWAFCTDGQRSGNLACSMNLTSGSYSLQVMIRDSVAAGVNATAVAGLASVTGIVSGAVIDPPGDPVANPEPGTWLMMISGILFASGLKKLVHSRN